MKPLSQNKHTFLEVVAHVNQQLMPEYRLDIEDALALYDSEISPYGYPTHQSLLLSEGMSMYHFNREIAKLKLKNKDGELITGEGFGHNVRNIFPSTPTGSEKPIDLPAKYSCPNYYITDDLADSLIETKPPEGKLDIDLEVLPIIKVIFSKKYNKINTVAISKRYVDVDVDKAKRENLNIKGEGIEVRVNYTVSTEIVEESPSVDIDFFIPFDGKGHCMLCDTRELFRETLLEKNYFKVRVASHPQKDSRYFVVKLKNNRFRFRWWEAKHETAVEIVNDFIENHMNDCYRFVINLLCLMTQEPEVISVQSPPSKYTSTKGVGFGSQKVNNVPNVHWLGEYFTTRVIDSKTKEGEPQGRSPKKSHWRRGHWHTILQGPGRKQRTMKWFKPTFIRGHKQTQEVSK